MKNIKIQYRELVEKVLSSNDVNFATKGKFKQSIGDQLIYDSFPLLTFRKLKYEAAFAEAKMIWEGETNIKTFRKNDINWWDAWDMGDGTIGETYGFFFKQYDILKMSKRPESRKNVITMWAPKMNTKQPACITQLQFLCDKRDNRNYIDLVVAQRSCDIALGLPYDLVMYYLWLERFVELCGPEYVIGKVILNFGSAHVYNSHIENMSLMINEFDSMCDLTWKGLDDYNKNIKPLLKSYKYDLKVGI